MKTKKITAAVAAAAITIGTAANAAAFPDVKSGDWYYDTVTAMTNKGLFAGIEENGTVYFKPENTMTHAEFIAVVDRILNLDTSAKGDTWWYGVYRAAVDAQLITSSEMSETDMDSDITRQEMAMVAVRAIEKRGETLSSQYAENVQASIPDNQKIDSRCLDFVLTAYENGILCGVDDLGTFDPNGTLTRAAAAAVLNRITEPTARESRDFSQPPDPLRNYNPITIYEGQPRDNRLAREGDIFVKADGTQVVLKIDELTGVLGYGQGIAPDVGIMDELGQGKNKTTRYLTANGTLTTGKYGPNSVGKNVSDSQYWVNPITDEGHWDSEWAVISDYTLPKEQGTEEGEISPDNNYIWDGMGWVTLACDNGRIVFEYYNK